MLSFEKNSDSFDGSLINILDAFDAYINGASTRSLKKKLAIYDDNLTLLEKDLYQTKISENLEVTKRLLTILKSLNASQKEQDNLNLELTIYEFLITLAKKGHPQIIYIAQQIDDKKTFRYLKLLLGPSILVSVVATVFSLATFHLIIELLKVIFSSLIAFPVMGLISNCCVNLYNLITNQFDNKKTSFNRWRDHLFTLASAAINISAYSFLIITGVATSPIAGGIFVISSIFNSLKETFYLIQETLNYKSKSPINENGALNVQKARTRYEFDYQKRMNTIGINLGFALLYVGISVFWGFVPGGLPIAITAITAMTVVFLVKTICIKYNAYRLRERLQTKLHELDKKYSESEIIEVIDLTVLDSDDDDEYSNAPSIQRKHAPPPPNQIKRTSSSKDLRFFAYTPLSNSQEEKKEEEQELICTDNRLLQRSISCPNLNNYYER